MVKIGYSASTGFVRVAIDEKNTGNFHICLNERVDLSPNWWRNARISVSAATGQLADNHDILAVETTQGVGDPDLVAVSASHEEAAAEKEDTELVQELLRENGVEVASLCETMKGLVRAMERTATEQQLKLSKLKRELEHSLVGEEVAGS